MRVKICGITNPDDARLAVDAGADALGFIFFEKSARHVTPDAAAQIIRRLPPFVARVGVFVDASADTIREIVRQTGIDTLQFHGDEPPAFCRQFAPLKVYKALRIQSRASLASLVEFDTDAWLLDSFVAGQLGGTGATFNWQFAVEAKSLGRPVILAGGLTPDNVADAVRTVRPFAVDVSSGVESMPGRKDAAKVRAFVQAAIDVRPGH